jgi:hypothetical protein
LPSGQVLIGGVNFNIPISTEDNPDEVRRALEGGESPLQMLNQQFVATQLSIIADGPFGGAGSPAVQASALRCYGVNFAPTQLSNGFTLSRNTTFGELVTQTQAAILENRTDDMPKLTMVLALLNGNNPNDRCR